MTVDTDIVLWINGHHSEWLDEAMWIISRPVTWIPLYILLVGLLWYRYRDWKKVLILLVGFGIAVGLSDFTASGILKPLFCRLRPTHNEALSLHIVHGYHGGLYGFCSSHAANTMSVALLFSLLYRNKTATSLLMVWVALNCYSRMYLGAHYPSDIMGGLLVGSLWALFVWLALSRWRHVNAWVARPDGS